jgi:hypothetical protein
MACARNAARAARSKEAEHLFNDARQVPPRHQHHV